MRILVISDLHGDLNAVHRAYESHRPDLILSCGDWGDPDQVTEPAIKAFLDGVSIYTTFGNHDPVEILARLRNQDGSAVLLGQGGHLHVAQEQILKDGRKVINVGATPEGSIVIVDFDAKQKTLDARLERLSAH